MAVIYVLHGEAQIWAKKQSSFKAFFITQFGHRHCLATIVFILDIYLWWLNTYAYGMGMQGMRSHPQRWKIGHYSGKNFQQLGKVYSCILM